MNNKTTLFLATLALATALPAQAGKALTVREHIDISAPPAKVWDTVRDFGSLAWHPAVATTTLDKGEKDKRGAVRTVTTKDGEFYAHLHMCAGNEQGQAFGGHLNRAVVSATCEMVVEVLDGTVDRQYDPITGLNLFKF